jgi:galactonate dehydratase
MERRYFLAGGLLTGIAGALAGAPAGRGRGSAGLDCGCAPALAAAALPPAAGRLKVTDMKVFGVTIEKNSDRPYVFVKIETDAGVIGWGEATLEGKAGAAMAAVNDLREYIVGADPMPVEHLWQSMYVHAFYRPGPILGSAISGIDQALWDIRGQVLGQPVYRLLGGPFDARGVRGYYHTRANTLEELRQVRATAKQTGVTAFKSGIPGWYEWLETNQKIRRAVGRLEQLREGLGDDIDIGIDFHAKTSPAVASILCKEVEPLNLMFIEEPCPPENARAMARIARRTTVPIATGERLVAHYSCRELCEQGIVDILQTDINHVGGITALWKVGALAEASGVKMAPHACEGPIGGIATLHVDASMPNFLVQEICSNVQPGFKEKLWEEWLGFPAMRMVNGYFPLSDKPGLGIELSEEKLAKWPFQGTRSMARPYHEDGSVAAF